MGTVRKMKPKGLLISILLCSVLLIESTQGSNDSSQQCEAEKAHSLWQNFRYTEAFPCLQWPLLRNYLSFLPIGENWKRDIERLHTVYWSVLNYGPDKGYSVFMEEFRQYDWLRKHKKILAEKLPGLLACVKPTEVENLSSMILQYAKWLRDTMVAPVYLGATNPDVVRQNMYRTFLKAKEELTKKYKSDQEDAVKGFIEALKYYAHLFTEEVVPSLKSFNECVLGDNGTNATFTFTKCTIKRIGKMYRRRPQYFPPGFYDGNLGRDYFVRNYLDVSAREGSMEQVFGDSLSCFFYQNDGRQGVQNELFQMLFGQTEPVQWLAEFIRPHPTLAAALESLIRTYPDQVKAFVHGAHALLGNTDRLEASITTLSTNLQAALEGSSFAVDLGLILRSYCGPFAEFQHAGTAPNLLLYAEAQLNNIIHDESWRLSLSRNIYRRYNMAKIVLRKLPYDFVNSRELFERQNWWPNNLNEAIVNLSDVISQTRLDDQLWKMFETIFPAQVRPSFYSQKTKLKVSLAGHELDPQQTLLLFSAYKTLEAIEMMLMMH